MDANQNPPSDRDWTQQEMEEFFANVSKQPPIEWSTGTWNGPLIELDPNDPFGDMERLFNPGVHITSIVPPEQGWPIAMYCPFCKETTFMLSPWGVKPKDGDYFQMNTVCASEEHSYEHNLNMSLKYGPSIHLSPFLNGILYGSKE